MPRNLHKKIAEDSDVLAFLPYSGYFVRIRRTAAAEIEPWNLFIEYVSLDKGKIQDVYRAGETGAKLIDGRGYSVSDILPVDNTDCGLQLYYGYVFTRVCYLYISSQPPALTVISWIRTLEQAFRLVLEEDMGRRVHDPKEVLRLVQLAHSMLPTVQKAMHNDQQMAFVVKAILEGNDIEKYFTNQYHVTSLAKLMGFLSLPYFPVHCILVSHLHVWQKYQVGLVGPNCGEKRSLLNL